MTRPRHSAPITLPPEFLLVVACCRWPPSKERLEAVQNAAAGPIDWPEVMRIARRERVEGLVRRGLVDAGIDPPPPIAAELRRIAAEIARQSLALAIESARLQRRLEGAGLKVMVLKGAAVEMLSYGTLGLKRAWDIDLLVTPDTAQFACACLTEWGYDLVEKDGLTKARFPVWVELAKDCQLKHRETGVSVELHWRLVDSEILLAGLSAASDARRVAVSAGLDVLTLEQNDLFSYLSVHGAMHGWFRLKWLADLAALLAHYGAGDLESLYRASRERGAGRCSAQALLLCERLFSIVLSPVLAAELRADGSTLWLEKAALMSMRDGAVGGRSDDKRFEANSHWRYDLLLGVGWPYKLEVLKRKWICVDDRMTIPLPRGLYFLYDVIRPPLWLWRRVGFVISTP